MGYKDMIKQIIKFAENILKAGGTGYTHALKQSGIVMMASFVTIFIITQTLTGFSGVAGVGYTFIILLLSLVISFGYGAIRFAPLIGSASETLKSLPKE